MSAPPEQAATDPLPDLSEAVRSRVLAAAADALGRLAAEELPAALKRVASFAPARRARLAGSMIAAVLETDGAFRERVADQLTSTGDGLAEAVASGVVPAAADPVEVAVAAYLVRPEGWQAMVAAADGRAREEQGRAGARKVEEQASRLRRRLAEQQEETQRQRQRHKEQTDRLRAENAELRRRLGDVRARLRETQEARGVAETVADELVQDAERRVAAAESEVRRLRNRVTELESDLATARRTERAARAGEAVRARLLLDTVVQATQGLQRELGLPALDRLPADEVAAELPEHGHRTSTGRASLPVDDPALLEELLRLPRAHLVVDGYNVTKTAWPDLSLERQRDRILTGSASLVARTGAEVTVVFDAADTRIRPLVPVPRGVRVLFSPYGVIADDIIRDLVAAEPAGRNLVVASSDQAVARDVEAAGFRVVAARALAHLLSR